MIIVKVYTSVPGIKERVSIKAKIEEHWDEKGNSNLPYEEEDREKIAEEAAQKIIQRFNLGDPGEGWQWDWRDTEAE